MDTYKLSIYEKQRLFSPYLSFRGVFLLTMYICFGDNSYLFKQWELSDRKLLINILTQIEKVH